MMLQKEKEGIIYGLKDPFTMEVRYVGFTTTTLSNRFSQHKYDSLTKRENTYKSKWFRSCFSKGSLPIAFVLEENVPRSLWEERENYHINSYFNLTNQRAGGTGIIVDRTTNSIEKSIANKKVAIVQFSLSGEYIQEWKSIRDAERGLNICKGSRIRAVIAQKADSCEGYLWCTKTEYDAGNIPVYRTKQEALKTRSHPNKRPIEIICLITNTSLGKFNSVTEGFNFLNVQPDSYVNKENILLKKYLIKYI